MSNGDTATQGTEHVHPGGRGACVQCTRRGRLRGAVNGGVVARVAKQALVIGRAEECGLVLGDISVSRHCSKLGALHVVTPEYLGVKGDQYGPPDLCKKGANGDYRCEWCRWHPESGHFRIG